MKVIRKAYTSNSDRRTVLLIGDGVGILKRISFALQHRGHSVIWAECGQTGLRVAESETPDLIVSEIELSALSGFAICRMIKASFFCEIPVVLVGKLDDEARDSPRAFRAGADDYFVSFTDWKFVMAKLEWLLQRRVIVSIDLGIVQPAEPTPISPIFRPGEDSNKHSGAVG